MRLLGKRIIYKELASQAAPKKKSVIILQGEDAPPTYLTGLVIAAGHECVEKCVGKEILVHRQAGQKIIWEGEELTIVDADQIVAIHD